jgi:hypothetical protein
MDKNLKGLLIGIIGVSMTAFAYQQDAYDPTRLIWVGLVICLFALGVKEGFIPL